MRFYYSKRGPKPPVFEISGGAIKGKNNFDQFWELATKGRYFFGEHLWVAWDVEILPGKNTSNTRGLVTELVPHLRYLLSLLSLFLFGGEFEYSVHDKVPWFVAITKKAGVGYEWEYCTTIICKIGSDRADYMTMLPILDRSARFYPHKEARLHGVRQTKDRIEWTRQNLDRWDKIFVECDEGLRIPRNTDVWNLVVKRSQPDWKTIPPVLRIPKISVSLTSHRVTRNRKTDMHPLDLAISCPTTTTILADAMPTTGRGVLDVEAPAIDNTDSVLDIGEDERMYDNQRPSIISSSQESGSHPSSGAGSTPNAPGSRPGKRSRPCTARNFHFSSINGAPSGHLTAPQATPLHTTATFLRFTGKKRSVGLPNTSSHFPDTNL